MVKDSDEWKYDPDKDSGNRDDELDVDVEGEENRVMGGKFGDNN